MALTVAEQIKGLMDLYTTGGTREDSYAGTFYSGGTKPYAGMTLEQLLASPDRDRILKELYSGNKDAFGGIPTAGPDYLAQYGITDPWNQLNASVPGATETSGFGADLWEAFGPIAQIGGIAAGANALAGLAGFGGGAGSFLGAGVDPVVAADAAAGTPMFGGGLTASLSEYATPNSVAGWSSEYPTIGNEGDWWTGMPAGTVEAAAGGGGGATSLWDTLTNALKGGVGSSLLDMLGKAAPGLISAYASGQQGDAIKDIAGQQQAQFDKYFQMGAPYRQRLSDLYANPAAFLTSPEVQVPVQQGTDALARSLSAKVGNPIGNMSALGELQNYSANNLFGRLGQEKDRLAGFGGLSAYNQAGASGNTLQAQLMGSNADAGVWGGLGRAAGDVFNQAPTLAELLKQMQGSNIFTVKG